MPISTSKIQRYFSEPVPASSTLRTDLDHKNQETAGVHAGGQRVVVFQGPPGADEHLRGWVDAPVLRNFGLNVSHLSFVGIPTTAAARFETA